MEMNIRILLRGKVKQAKILLLDDPELQELYFSLHTVIEFTAVYDAYVRIQ